MLSELPPRAEVLDVLQAAVAPTAGAVVVVFGLLTTLAWLLSKQVRFDWRKATPSIAVLALVAGLVAGNHFRGGFDHDYEKWTKWWHWAWPAIGFALGVEFLASLPGRPAAGYLLRGTAAGVVAWAVTPPAWQMTPADKWIVPAVAFALAIQWAIVARVGQQSPGGSTCAAMACAALGAVAILMHHRWNPTGTIVTTALFSALVTLAVLAWATRSDAGSGAAATTAPIATMLLLGRSLLDSNVPRSSFLLVGLAPLVLGVFLLPSLNRFSAYRAATPVKVLLVLIPVAAAIYLAMDAEPLMFETESEADEWK